VHDIEEDCEAESMGSVNQLFEFFGSTVARASREETRDLISERFEE
jgi:hypothetical protein